METGPRNKAPAEEGRGAASDWLSGRAAFTSCTCAVTPRRGRGEAKARWVPGRVSQGQFGTRSSWLRHVGLSGEGKWRSQRPHCSRGLSPPRRRPNSRRHCCTGPPGLSGCCMSTGSQPQVMMSRALRASVRAVRAGPPEAPCRGALLET